MAIVFRASIIVAGITCCIMGAGLYIVVGGAEDAGPAGPGTGPLGATFGAGPGPGTAPQLEQPPTIQPDVIIGCPQPP